jgi:hypothetical protein
MKDEFFVVDLADGSYVKTVPGAMADPKHIGSVGNPLVASRFYDVEGTDRVAFVKLMRRAFSKARFVKVVATAEVVEL